MEVPNQRFLQVGHAGLQEDYHDKDISIRVLELNFQTPDVPENLQIYHKEPQSITRRREKDSVEYVLGAKPMLQFVKAQIDMVLEMSYHTGERGAIFYEKIGMLRYLLDGKLYEEVDLSELLGKLGFNNSFGREPWENRLACYKEWKSRALKKRTEAGFPATPLSTIIS